MPPKAGQGAGRDAANAALSSLPTALPPWDGHLPWPRYPQSLCKGSLASIDSKQDLLTYVRSCQAVRLQRCEPLALVAEALCSGLDTVRAAHCHGTYIAHHSVQLNQTLLSVSSACVLRGLRACAALTVSVPLKYHSACGMCLFLCPQSLRGPELNTPQQDSDTPPTQEQSAGPRTQTVQRWAVPQGKHPTMGQTHTHTHTD